MLLYSLITDGLFTAEKTEQGYDLNMYCKLEGMDYQQLVSESHSNKKQTKTSKN